MKYKFDNSILILILVSSLIFGYFLILNNAFPYWIDDYEYAAQKVENPDLNIQKFQNLYSFIKKASDWNPRIGNGMTAIFLSFDKVYCNIFIALCNLCFILLVFFYSLARWPTADHSARDAFLLFSIFILYLYITPRVLDTMAWATGAMNHLFGNILILGVFIPYYYLPVGQNKLKDSLLTVFFFSIACFIASFNVQTSVPIFIVSMSIAVCIYYLRFNKIQVWSICGIISAIISFVLLINHRSVKIRMDAEGIDQSKIYNVWNILSKISIRFDELFRFLNLSMLFYIISAFSMLLFFYILIRRKSTLFEKYSHLIRLLIFSSIFLFSVIFLAVSPYLVARMTVLQVFLTLCVFTCFFKQIELSLNKQSIFAFILVALIVFPLQKEMFDIYFVAKNIDLYTELRKQDLLQQAKTAKENDVIYVRGPFIGKVMPKEINEKDGQENYYITDWFDPGYYVYSLRRLYKIKQKIVLKN